MKILITGAAGMLANDVAPYFQDQNHEVIKTDINLRTADIEKLDVTDQKQVLQMTEKIRPDYVFHLAAATNVDQCEQEPDMAYRVNTLGTENAVLACQQFGATLVYVSTAAVFPGDKPTPYTEFDRTQAANIYGDSKRQGEEVVANLLSKYYIVRAGWMIGGWELDKKFVYKIIQQLKEGKSEIKAVNDKFGSPTFTNDFAYNLSKIIETGRYGLYHLANKGTASRYEIACQIVDAIGLKNDVKVSAVSSNLFPLPAPRGRSEMMDNYKLNLLNLNVMPTWQDSLRKYILENAEKTKREKEEIEAAR